MALTIRFDRVARMFGVGLCVTGAIASAAGVQSGPNYAYDSATFASFVIDSYKEAPRGKAADFFAWFETSFAKASGQSVDAFVTSAKKRISSSKMPNERLNAELAFCRDLHKSVKKAIPKFDLDRGFEFHYTASRGERQCFLQAVLIAGILQKGGVDAGVAMVFRNERGEPSNNGHAVTLVRLDIDADLIVDASEPHPFATHKGLFLPWRNGDYQYVEPLFSSGPVPYIESYNLPGKRGTLKPNKFEFLDLKFLRSQFDYYRGERAAGGFLAAKPTPTGINASLRYLNRSIAECPKNPLAMYILGRVQEKAGYLHDAAKTYGKAIGLYAKFGWTPNGVQKSLARVNRALPKL